MTKPARILTRFVDILLGLVVVALALRLVLKLFGANSAADFVAWVYITTDPLLEPFRGMFPAPVVEPGFILEFSTLFAILAYSILAWLLIEFFVLIDDAAKDRSK